MAVYSGARPPDRIIQPVSASSPADPANPGDE
jgi:hypothetical protein